MAAWDDIAVVIRTVPHQREVERQALCTQLMGMGIAYRLAWHQPGRTVAESYGDALMAGLTAWAAWVLQLEDDIRLVPCFATEVTRLLTSLHKSVGLVSFYSGRRIRPGEILPSPPILEYGPGRQFLMAQAIALPAPHIPALCRYVLAWKADHPMPGGTDLATAAWLAATRLPYARTWPSLVQHGNGVSLLGHHRHPNRQSASFDRAWGAK